MSYFSDLDIAMKEASPTNHRNELWENFGCIPKEHKKSRVDVSIDPSTHVEVTCRKCNLSVECDLPKTDSLIAFEIAHYKHGVTINFS